MKKQYFPIIFISFVLCVLICVSCAISLYLPDFYAKETLNWQAQCIGQDVINITVILPFLLISCVNLLAGRNNAQSLWAGSILYLLYTYLIYCFDVHFNIFFLIYCIILGVCFYLLLYYFYLQTRCSAFKRPSSRLRKTIAVYFIVLSVVFYFLWLSDVLPATLNATVPESLVEVGLPTNAVHVIDLSVVLPGMFITGILLLKEKKVGFILAPILLSFFILMDLTIGALTVFMYLKGIETNLSVAVIMVAFTIWSTILLTFYLKSDTIQ